MRPEKFSDSDAMFNVGVAVGALDACKVYYFTIARKHISFVIDAERDDLCIFWCSLECTWR